MPAGMCMRDLELKHIDWVIRIIDYLFDKLQLKLTEISWSYLERNVSVSFSFIRIWTYPSIFIRLSLIRSQGHQSTDTDSPLPGKIIHLGDPEAFPGRGEMLSLELLHLAKRIWSPEIQIVHLNDNGKKEVADLGTESLK